MLSGLFSRHIPLFVSGVVKHQVLLTTSALRILLLIGYVFVCHQAVLCLSDELPSPHFADEEPAFLFERL